MNNERLIYFVILRSFVVISRRKGGDYSYFAATERNGTNRPLYYPVSFSVRKDDKLFLQVYWMKMSEPNPITVGDFVYSPDERFGVQIVPQLFEWNLKIKDVQYSDAGVYFCAISATEKREKYRHMVLLRVKGESLIGYKAKMNS